MSAQNSQKPVENFNPEESYDSVPYESYSYPLTHPQHMYTIAKLFGLNPPDFRKARVLEIGCAGGVNIFSQALQNPDAQYLGFDISGEQIDQANKSLEFLKLKNVEFRQQDILEFDLEKNKGAFDYIMCHGIFSWVPAIVQDRVLELCGKCLSENGLAIISYNTLPGWNIVRSIRDMMLFHVKKFKTPKEKIVQARALLEFLMESMPEKNTGYRAVVEDELNMLRRANDSYLFHDHLEGVNTQFYFHEFASRAAKSNLVYVGDSALSAMFVGNLPKRSAEKLSQLTDIIQQEQYIDFIHNRRFRMSIVTKGTKQFPRQIDARTILGFCLCSNMTPAEGAKIGDAVIVFTGNSGSTFTANNSILSALYLTLAAQGKRAISANDLVDKTHAALPSVDRQEIENTLVASGVQLALHGYVSLSSGVVSYVDQAGTKPVVSPLARLQASQPGCVALTNMLHLRVETNPIANILITLLDGTRTIEDAIREMSDMAIEGKIMARDGDKPLTDPGLIRMEMSKIVNAIIALLEKESLLIA